jgi:hypothetical protein
MSRGNPSGHTSVEMIESLGKGEGRIEGHLLPCYASETNPIERVGWPWHENSTRNHRGKDLGNSWMRCSPC